MKILKSYKHPNQNLLIVVLISFIIFLLVELTARIYAIYKNFPPIDLATHFFGGIALGLAIYWVLSMTAVKRKKNKTILLTFIGAIIWEIMEKLQELVFINPPYNIDIFFYDGVTDIIVTVMGGIFALLLIDILKNKTHILKEYKMR